MSKFKIPNQDSTLNPYAEEDVLSGRNLLKTQPSDPYLNASKAYLEDFSTLEVDPGQSLYGDSSFAEQVINERKAYDQGALELVGKGLFNVAKTIGIEIAKTPGYLVGAGAAAGNELFGDGKDSMSMMVDNAWVNAFEKLDEAAKEAIPVHFSKQVQEGNLLDKLGSGAWWASSGADGLGFMLAMFAPGAAAKALKVGSGVAKAGEGLGNLAPKLGKYATGLGLLEDAGEAGFKYTQNFARNANGVASATLNTVLESSAEAANTFDNLKGKFINEGLSEEEASLKAGEGAAAVFKGNMSLLFISNLIDEKWLWKSFGSAGEKEAASSILNRVTKDGVIDLEALKKIPQEFTRKAVLKKAASNFGKGVIKEGAYEEGSQTTLQQNVEEGKIGQNFLDDLINVGSSYFDDFTNNTELHESIFLGGLLGGGASVIKTINENRALKEALTGTPGRPADNFWVKYGILPETKAQKGFLNIVGENHINQFRSYKDFIDKDSAGNITLNEQKLADANLEKIDNVRTDILYDLAVEEKDNLSREIYGQFLAANYVQPFLGQEGSKELFADHVKNQVVPAWQKRFEETFGRAATNKEVSDYERNFTESGNRVINSYTQAEQTHYPERFYSEQTKEYQDFKQQYFHQKFQTLVGMDAVKERKVQLQQEMLEKGILETDLENIKDIDDVVKKVDAALFKKQLSDIEQLEKQYQEYYPKFFTKEGVKEMFDNFKSKKTTFEELSNEEKEQNTELKKKVDGLPGKNQEVLENLIVENEKYLTPDVMNLKDKDGKPTLLEKNPENGEWTLLTSEGSVEIRNYKGDLSALGLQHDDITAAEYNTFKDTGKAPASVLNRIAEKLNKGELLTPVEEEIFEGNTDEITALQEKLRADKKQPIFEPKSETSESDGSILDKAVSEVEKKKGVNLYPSTGRNVKDNLVKIGDLYVEELSSKPSQKLWFETMEEVTKDPTSYTVQVVRRDDQSNSELHQQIMRDIDPGNTKPGDLYTVLYKNGKAVVKEGNYVFTSLWRPENLYPLTDNGKPKEFIIAEEAVLENFKLHVQRPLLDLERISKKDKDVLEKAGYPDATKNSIREAAFFLARREYQDWYQNLQDVNESNANIEDVERRRKEEIGKFPRVDESTSKEVQELYGKYREISKKWNGFNVVGLRADSPTLKEMGEAHAIANEYFKQAKELHYAPINAKYNAELATQKNKSFQLQVAGVTNGHKVKAFSDAKGENPVWSRPLSNIPGLKLEESKNPKPSDLKGARFELAIQGSITINGEEVKVEKGDVVLIDDENNIHATRARNINEEEINTILYLLSLRADTDQPTETIKVKPEGGVKFGNELLLEVPVFYNGKKSSKKGESRKNLIETLISFGTKNGGKGEIYFNQQSILDGNPLLVWTDFNGETHNIEVSKIKTAVNRKDFSDSYVASLRNFLSQKRFNVNEHLLGSSDKVGNPLFNKPTLTYKVDESGNKVPELSWDNSKSYYHHLLNDILTTTTTKVPGYPNRVQRNLWFNKEPIQEEVFNDRVLEEVEIPALKTRLDEIQTLLDRIFNEQLDGPQSREILQQITDLTGSEALTTGLAGRTITLKSKTVVETIKAFLKQESAPVKKERRRPTKSVDDFRDKTLTTSDLLRVKIQSGEIIQKCK